MSQVSPLLAKASICSACRRQLAHKISSPSFKRSRLHTQVAAHEDGLRLGPDALVRAQQLGGKAYLPRFYPRPFQSTAHETMSAAHFNGAFREELARRKRAGEEDSCGSEITVYGRVTALRHHGGKLMFLSIYTPGNISSQGPSAQVVLSLNRIHDNDPAVTQEDLKNFRRSVQRGDWIAVAGHAGETESGHWSVKASSLPEIISPSLRTVPEQLEDIELRMHNRHVDQIVNPSSLDVLYLRHMVTSNIRRFFTERDFIEVSTPLLVANAGGASARPFITRATELSDVDLSLRIAPELFLKRLIVGGMQRIFEMGPMFRNEGLDHTHNPEFTMCEFYAAMLSLPDLMKMTEELFWYLSKSTEENREKMQLPALDVDFSGPFKTIEFIPGLEQRARDRLPNWTFPDDIANKPDAAIEALQELMSAFAIPMPATINVAQCLDHLASELLEPQCVQPTFITYYPECMSPLAKSFEMSPTIESSTSSTSTGASSGPRRVSARAELFIQGREYVNCYEEENSPVEQRRKFEEQAASSGNGPGDRKSIDENYLKALEWGMPPTGGWGAGVDRIVMLFSGKKRIADVLSFGSLRNVVSLGPASTRRDSQ